MIGDPPGHDGYDGHNGYDEYERRASPRQVSSVGGQRPRPTEKPAGQQCLGEEIANSISHRLGLLSTLVVTPFLILSAAHRGDLLGIVGVCIFALSLVLLYATSMLYHALSGVRAMRVKQVFQVLVHSAIYLLIAGIYSFSRLGYCAVRGAERCLVWCGPGPWPAQRPNHLPVFGGHACQPSRTWPWAGQR